jgi:hypothetical protein
LISKSKLLSLPVFERLLNYISVTISKSQNPENGLSIIAGISSEDYPYWMTAMVCVRRLTLGDISGKDPKAHLVAFIHKFVNNKAVDSDVGFDKRLKSKKIGEGSTDLECIARHTQEQSLSMLKAKHVPLRDIAEMVPSRSLFFDIILTITTTPVQGNHNLYKVH